MTLVRNEEAAIVRSLCEQWHNHRDLDLAVLGVAAEHVALRALCDRLEEIADALPTLPAAEECHSLARQLTALVPRHHRRGRAVLERLAARDAVMAEQQALVDRVRGQQATDEAHAQDLSEALLTLPGERGSRVFERGEAAALGYMLRCFFDGARRAMAFEELALLTVGGRRLAAATVACLHACLGTGTVRHRVPGIPA